MPGGKRIRTLWGWRRIHKWLAVCAGVFLTVWIVSGVVIAIPGGGAPAVPQLQPPLDLEAATVSPAEAVAAVRALGVEADRFRNATLQRLGSRPAYVLQVAGRGPIIVDARSGEIVEIDGPEAARIASATYGGSGTAGEPELADRYGLRYFMGGLPAYRVAFDDEFGTEAYVAVRDGSVTWWDGRSRARRLMAAAHDWWPIGRLIHGSLRMGLIYVASALALGATLTGYWLALRRKGRGR